MQATWRMRNASDTPSAIDSRNVQKIPKQSQTITTTTTSITTTTKCTRERPKAERKFDLQKSFAINNLITNTRNIYM